MFPSELLENVLILPVEEMFINNNRQHLLTIFSESNTIISILHELSHLIIMAALYVRTITSPVFPMTKLKTDFL